MPVSDIYVVFLMVRLFLGSNSLRGSLLAFLSSAFYPSRNDCNMGPGTGSMSEATRVVSTGQQSPPVHTVVYIKSALKTPRFETGK